MYSPSLAPHQSFFLIGQSNTRSLLWEHLEALPMFPSPLPSTRTGFLLRQTWSETRKSHQALSNGVCEHWSASSGWITLHALWAGALSWSKIHDLFFHYSGQNFQIISLDYILTFWNPFNHHDAVDVETWWHFALDIHGFFILDDQVFQCVDCRLVDSLPLFLVTHCYRHETKPRSLLTCVENILLQRQKGVFVLAARAVSLFNSQTLTL